MERHLLKLETLLNDKKLLQIDTSIDSYYIGPFSKLNEFCFLMTDCKKYLNEHIKNEECKNHYAWISDNDVCLKRLPIPVTTSKEVLEHFRKALNPIIFKIVVCNMDGQNEVIFKYIEQDFHYILPFLIMGSAKSIDTASNHYDCAINCTTNVARPKQLEDKNYLQLGWEDSQFVNIIDDFERILMKMNEWIAYEKTILVYCEQGISRSAACVLLYLLQYYDFKTSYEKLIQKRLVARPNNGFLKQLKTYEAKNFLSVTLLQE